MIVKVQAGTLGFKPNCPVEPLEAQEAAMREYLRIMEIRAEKEAIGVSDLV